MVQFKSVNTTQKFIDFTDGTSPCTAGVDQSAIFIENGTIGFAPFLLSSKTVQAAQYYQFVFTRASSGHFVLYIDGEVYLSGNVGDKTELKMGNLRMFYDEKCGYFTEGRIARLRLYDSVLSPAIVYDLDRLPVRANPLREYNFPDPLRQKDDSIYSALGCNYGQNAVSSTQRSVCDTTFKYDWFFVSAPVVTTDIVDGVTEDVIIPVGSDAAVLYTMMKTFTHVKLRKIALETCLNSPRIKWSIGCSTYDPVTGNRNIEDYSWRFYACLNGGTVNFTLTLERVSTVFAQRSFSVPLLSFDPALYHQFVFVSDQSHRTGNSNLILYIDGKMIGEAVAPYPLVNWVGQYSHSAPNDRVVRVRFFKFPLSPAQISRLSRSLALPLPGIPQPQLSLCLRDLSC
jgi:hypothetical protein